MFLLVHRTRAGWVESCPDVRFDSETEALQILPTMCDLLQKPACAVKVVEQRIHDAQLV